LKYISLLTVAVLALSSCQKDEFEELMDDASVEQIEKRQSTGEGDVVGGGSHWGNKNIDPNPKDDTPDVDGGGIMVKEVSDGDEESDDDDNNAQ